MSSLIDSAKELFEKVKPLLMSEEKNDAGANPENPTPENPTPENPIPENETPAIVAPSSESETTPPPTPLNVVSAIINGAGVGLLLGILLGLAISPVVSGVIGTLSGLLAVLLGLNEKYITPLKGIRIGAFGFFCVVGIFYGMNVRINNGLLPSRARMMEEYTKVGFSQSEARDFIAYREFNLIPANWRGGESSNKTEGATLAETGEANQGEENNAAGNPASGGELKMQLAENGKARVFANPNETGAERKSVLYSSEIDASACYVLDLANENQPASEIKNTFEEAGGTWKELAQQLASDLPEKVFVHALLTIRDCFCESGQTGKMKMTNCETVSKISDKDSLDKIRKTLSSSGQTWNTIEVKVSKEIPEQYQKTLYLSLIKILCHD